MSEIDLVKHHLRKIPGGSLELIDKAWIEIALERNNGNRSAACKDLNISICKIRSWIELKGIRITEAVLGHPPKEVKTKLRRKVK